MKYSFYIFAVIIIAVPVLLINFIKTNPISLPLTKDIVWEINQDGHTSQIINSNTNEILVGPSAIQLWGRYPYLVGQEILGPSKFKPFAYNISTHTSVTDPWEAEQLLSDISFIHNQSRLISSGCYSNSFHYKHLIKPLRAALKKPDESK